MRIIPNQSEKLFVSRLMKNGKKSIRLNPINSETSIRMKPNQSETKFSIQINPSSDWSKPNFQSKSIQMNPRSEWFGLIFYWKFGLDQSEIGFIRIGADCCLGLNRTRSDRFFIVFHETSYKTFFGLIRDDSHCLGYRYRNKSE